MKRDYPDLNFVRVVVIGRDAPMDPNRYLYRHPERRTPFAEALYRLLGVEDFPHFVVACAFTDALRCHIQSPRIPERALANCAHHLREELKQFPNLHTVVVLGEDAYQQFQRDILQRKGNEVIPFAEIMKPRGWSEEDVPFPLLPTGTLHAIYCYHPAIGYNVSPSIAHALPPLDS